MTKRRRKTMSKKDKEIANLQLINNHNIKAMTENTKYTFSLHDLKTIKPLNHPQSDMFKSFFMGNHIVADGSAGTGKTFAAVYLALNDLLSKQTPFKKIIIVRSAVATRDIGFLPGTEEEKMEVYERPYIDMFDEICKSRDVYSKMKLTGKVQFMPTSFIRGLNWDDAIVIVDEVQNLTFHEINSVLTRLGQNSKIVLCGDFIQSDLAKGKHNDSGIAKLLRVVDKIDDFDCVTFTTNDIIRSEFVKRWIIALEADGENY